MSITAYTTPSPARLDSELQFDRGGGSCSNLEEGSRKKPWVLLHIVILEDLKTIFCQNWVGMYTLCSQYFRHPCLMGGRGTDELCGVRQRPIERGYRHAASLDRPQGRKVVRLSSRSPADSRRGSSTLFPSSEWSFASAKDPLDGQQGVSRVVRWKRALFECE